MKHRHWSCRPETGGPALLLFMSLLGLIAANSPLRGVYALLGQPLWLSSGKGTGLPVALYLPELDHPSLAGLITIGPMTLFFLVITLELKKELVSGHLASMKQCLLPCLSALGGVVVPACLYAFIACPDPALHPGWAIPIATDAAFTMPVLLALGRHVSSGGRVWVMALAIFDDVLGILVIAIFYGGTLHYGPLLGAAVLAGGLAMAGRAGARCLWLYGVVGALLWLCLLAAGLHPTLAGVVTGLCLPTAKHPAAMDGPSPLERVEVLVGPWVTWLVLPCFGFVSVGVPLFGLPAGFVSLRLVLAIAVGLVLGKGLGIFTATVLAVRSRLASLPAGTSWRMLFGLCLLCGLGFTVSLFMAGLAFSTPGLLVSARIGILAGSLFAAASGWLWLRLVR